MADVKNAVEIARSPEDVFDYCVDLAREPEWNPKARRVEKLTEGPIGLGTRFEAEFLKGNAMTIELVRFERPTRWETATQSRVGLMRGEPLQVEAAARSVPSRSLAIKPQELR